MAKIGLPKGPGKWLKVREKSVKSQGILKWILSGNPVKIVSILANSGDPDEMLPYAAFHLGLHCLPDYLFMSIRVKRVNMVIMLWTQTSMV